MLECNIPVLNSYSKIYKCRLPVLFCSMNIPIPIIRFTNISNLDFPWIKHTFWRLLRHLAMFFVVVSQNFFFRSGSSSVNLCVIWILFIRYFFLFKNPYRLDLHRHWRRRKYTVRIYYHPTNYLNFFLGLTIDLFFCSVHYQQLKI